MKKIRTGILFKSMVFIVVLLVAFTIATTIIGSLGLTGALLDQYSDDAFRTARTAAAMVNGNRIDEYIKSEGKTDEYRLVWSGLDELCNTQDVTFIYVIQPDQKDYNHITFLFSTINHKMDYELYDFGYVRKTTNDDYRRKYKLLCEGKSSQELVIRSIGYIETDPHITAMVPVKDHNDRTRAILCVQRQMDELAGTRLTYLKSMIKVLLLTVLIVMILLGIFITQNILSPVRKIANEANRFASENVLPEKKLRNSIRVQDEIGKLAESIDQMEEQINDYVENMTRITAEREKIITELQLAARIQKNMLPDTFPAFPDRSEFDIYAAMEPAKEVGGDFYDFFLTDEDHLCMMIADVSGKGIPAALFMMATMIILHNSAMMVNSPGEILANANNALYANNHDDMFATVWIGILEISTGRLIAANAGHEYPVIKNPDGNFTLFRDKHGLVLGAMEGMEYKEYEIMVRKGSKLFVYTDGVPEATDAGYGMFGTERMVKALNENAEGSPEEILAGVRKAIDEFVDDAEQFDDLTMLCFEYFGGQQ